MGSGKFAFLKEARNEAQADKQNSDSAERAVDPAELTTPETPEQTPRRGRPPGKRSNDNYVQVTAYIRKDTHKDAKIALLQADDDRDFSDLVDELLSEWIQKASTSGN